MKGIMPEIKKRAREILIADKKYRNRYEAMAEVEKLAKHILELARTYYTK